MISLKDRVALITGASRGIGRATAVVLARRGARVACIGRDDNALHHVVEEITSTRGEAFSAFCDVRDEWSVKRTVEFVLQQYGKIDILANNAGLGIQGRVEDYTLIDWRTTLDSNLTGAFLFSRAVIPIMKARKFGRIINVSSGAGRNGIAGYAAYCASKFGLIGFTESLGLELRDDGIQVSSVLPGSTDTQFGKRIPEDENAEQSERARLSPFEVAEAIANLCESNPNAWISELVIRPLRVKPQN
ncbi:MAG TPA: SDR family NAD(P)-dependent oxidoreductase [Anaerolineae bacterium]